MEVEIDGRRRDRILHDFLRLLLVGEDLGLGEGVSK
jgi:hypothetical protein